MIDPPDDARGANQLGNRRLIAARAAAFVLGSVMVWSIVGGAVAAVEHALLDVPNAVSPSFATRATLMLAGHALELAVLVLAVRHAASSRQPYAWPLPTIALVGFFFLMLASAGGAAASVWFPMRTAEALGAHGVDSLLAWTQDSIELNLLGLKMYIAVVLVAFLYCLWRWQSAARA